MPPRTPGRADRSIMSAVHRFAEAPERLAASDHLYPPTNGKAHVIDSHPLFAAAVTAAFAVAVPAQAAPSGVTQISSDPFPADSQPTAAHATEVEPDTFSWGSTVVSVFQTGRVFNGGSSDIGFATSLNGGVSWTHGFLPATTTASTPSGPFFAASDASVAYDARDGVWMTSWLGLHASGGGIVDVMASRSTDGGLTWSAPVTIAATGVFYDKNWTVCDNTLDSPFYGNCRSSSPTGISASTRLRSPTRRLA
jgi:hypothetical protein